MRFLCMLLLLTTSVLADIPQPKIALPIPRDPIKARKTKGKWYMAEDGHAVYCYGPTMMVNGPDGPQKIALFCAGGKMVVTLRD